jgi:hypothetical protein
MDDFTEQKILAEVATALEFLQSIYRNHDVPLPVRMQAAKAAIEFESPKLSVVASVKDDGTFAQRLDRALARSGMTPKLIEATPIPDKAEE